MKKLLILIPVLIFFLQSHAQQKQLKKLQQQLKEHPQADTFRVNRLTDMLKLQGNTIGLRDSASSEALSLARKLHYPEGESRALVAMSRVKFIQNDAPQAFALVQQGLIIAEKIKGSTLVYALSNIGNLKQQIGENKAALAYLLRAEAVAQTTHDKALLARVQLVIEAVYESSVGDYATAMDWALKAEKNGEEINDLGTMASAWSTLAGLYTAIGDKTNSLIFYKKALEANKTLDNSALEFSLLNRIGEMHRLSGRYTEAIKSYNESLTKINTPYNIELTQSNLADVYVRMGNLPMALKYGFISLSGATKIKDVEGEEWIDGVLARAYLKLNNADSALYYALNGYKNALHTNTIEFKRDNAEALKNAYAMKKDFAKAFSYQGLYVSYRDSMSSAEVTNHVSVLQYNYNLAKKQAQIIKLNQDKKAQRSFLTAAAIVIGLIIISVIILIRNNRQKQKANAVLAETLSDLKLTQTQLIQSEKMASLGELTAGIAHEIQNPLNFVNNFSEVNTELINELQEERKKPVRDIKNEDDILNDIKENGKKINMHGKRADSIVKGMLQHSQLTSGIKEPTNINALADEYMRLAYHGLRAKDKSFNVKLTSYFDEQLPKVKVIPQDVGRIILNLFNNAFYAVNQKAKAAGTEYEPEVTVTTSIENGQAVIKVKDNGIGMPEHIKEKIMQPFFTTKPTGEGTGLGLSLTYDMVVKGHGGSIQVNSTEGVGTEFIVYLPIDKQA